LHLADYTKSSGGALKQRVFMKRVASGETSPKLAILSVNANTLISAFLTLLKN
jgi:hypothetical protein